MGYLGVRGDLQTVHNEDVQEEYTAVQRMDSAVRPTGYHIKLKHLDDQPRNEVIKVSS